MIQEPFCDSRAKNLCVIQEPRAKIQDRFDLDVEYNFCLDLFVLFLGS